MSLLLKLLLKRLSHASAFLFPKAGTDEDPAAHEAVEDPALEDIGDDPHDDSDDEPESDLDGPEASANTGNLDAQPSTRAPSRSAKAITELRERSQRLERELEEVRAERTRQAAGPTAAEREQQAEESRLRDPDVSDMEKWQIRSNQTLRTTVQQSQAALARAADDRDAAAYERKAAANAVYDKYKDKVEAEVTRARQQSGQLVKREDVLAYIVGRDMIAGNLKSKTTTQAKPVARGKPTGARSDTPARGSMTDAQKRAARLENQLI